MLTLTLGPRMSCYTHYIPSIYKRSFKYLYKIPFTAYTIRARKIIVEEFRQQEGRPPNEFELQDFLKMVVVPFGILKQQNGNSHSNSLGDIVKQHPELSIEGDKIVMRRLIKPTEVFHKVRDELKKRGWEYIAPKHVGGDKWEPDHFELKEGVKA